MGSCLAGDIPGGLSYGPPSTSGRRKDRKKLRRTISSSSSTPYGMVDSQLDALFHRASGKLCSNGCSDAVSLFTKQGKKGINQDAMIVWENFGSKADTIFCGVFDGHGPNGHFVSRKVRDILPLKLSSQWELICNTKNEVGGGSNDAVGSQKSEENASAPPDLACTGEQNGTFLTWKDSFVKAFKVMDKELKLHPRLDCYCSGTTAVALVKQGRDLVIGNVGDSRAVLGTRDGDNCCIAVQLTVDLKPNVPRELERIRHCKGRVFSLTSEPEVPRVWLPNCDSPGLAMARAFGDFCLKDYGLISVPDVSHYRISEKDEFVVLATDGIWDVLSNDEVVTIVSSAPRPTAARVVVETAVQVWRSRHPSSKVDDCAVVCLFLNPGSNNTSTSSVDQKIVPEIININGNNEASAPVGLNHSGTTGMYPDGFISKT